MANTFEAKLSVGPLTDFEVVGLRMRRALGKVAEAELDVRTRIYGEPDAMLGLPAKIVFGRGGDDHEFDGLVTNVSMRMSPQDEDRPELVYHVKVSSVMAILEQEQDSRIFQNQDVKDIVTSVLNGVGVTSQHLSWRLSATYAKREYCVQYAESSLSFVSRLLEEEGILFRSESGPDGELIVFDDDTTQADPIEDKEIPYRHGGGLLAPDDSISSIVERRRTATNKITFRDYDFKKPGLDLTTSAQASDGSDLEMYDYPGLYIDPAIGKRLAQVRLEALQAERFVLELESGCARLVPGKIFTLSGAPNGLDGDYLIVDVAHDLALGAYGVRATVIPKSVPYRTPQKTPRPILDGPQTATVVCPPGSKSDEIHTDDLGRCKVQFHWDRLGQGDDKSSCWIRTAQQQTSGSMMLPRVDWEVIVEFLEGNPDRPIVTGRVFNGSFPPPYALPEGKARTAIGSTSSPGGGGRNQIRMDDKAGSEEVAINSQKDTSIATANDKTKSTAANESKNVAVNTTLTVGGNQSTKITNGFQNGVKASQTVSVGGNRTVEINAVYGMTSGGASTTSVGGNQMEMDGNPIQALLSLAVKAATAAAQAEAAKAMQSLDQAVSSKVDQVMGPINDVAAQAGQVGAAMDAVSNGNFGAMASAAQAASGIPGPGDVAAAASSASSSTGLDALVHGAIAAGGDALGAAVGGDAAGGGGASEANTAGPVGAVGGNAAADSATGPGWAINECSSTHAEKVGSIKATIAAAGIHTTVKGARTQTVGAARVELVGGTRAETCQADKTEKAVGLVVLTKSPESETVAGARTTMVGGAILEKISGNCSISASGKTMLVGAFHKIDASSSIVFKCGESEVVIDGSGVAIKAAGAITITAPNVTLTSTTNEGC
jgi:type VI secretion system secreted protein VgrG